MVKKVFATVLTCSLLSSVPLQARCGEALLLGGIAGLATGFVASAIAQNCRKPDVVFVEEPPVVIYEPAPYVVYEEPCVMYKRPCRKKMCRAQAAPVQQKQIIKETIVEKTQVRPASANKDAELALKERQLELELIKAKKELLNEENRKKELVLKEKELEKKKSKEEKKGAVEEVVTKTITRSVA